jgi:hypothetical protein
MELSGPGMKLGRGGVGRLRPRPSDACGLFWRETARRRDGVPVSGAETSGARLRSGSLRKDHHTLVEEGPPTIRRRVNHPKRAMLHPSPSLGIALRMLDLITRLWRLHFGLILSTALGTAVTLALLAVPWRTRSRASFSAGTPAWRSFATFIAAPALAV